MVTAEDVRQPVKQVSTIRTLSSTLVYMHEYRLRIDDISRQGNLIGAKGLRVRELLF